jgi:hypothetical protein
VLGVVASAFNVGKVKKSLPKREGGYKIVKQTYTQQYEEIDRV